MKERQDNRCWRDLLASKIENSKRREREEFLAVGEKWDVREKGHEQVRGRNEQVREKYKFLFTQILLFFSIFFSDVACATSHVYVG